jgi:hypothetical protein
LGTIWAPRMDYIIRTLVETFFGFVLGERDWVHELNEAFPEVVYINGSVPAL